MRGLLVVGALGGCSAGPEAEPPPAMVVFAGDLAPVRGIALSRVRDPWRGLVDAFGAEARWVANLETAVADPRDCPRADGLCLRLDPADVPVLDGGPFTVLSRANNHAEDFGPDVLHATSASRYPTSGTTASFEDPGGRTWAVVPLDLTAARQADLDQAVRAVSLARQQTPRVAGFLHSGPELDPRLDAAQVRAAKALHRAGAVLVVGSGAHVIQEHSCGEHTLTFAGLGNLWMDQRPAVTREGLALGCQADDDSLTCTPRRLRHSLHQGPAPSAVSEEPCTVPLGPVDQTWAQHPRADRFAQVLPLPAAGPGAWIALWPQHSDFDHRTDLRPYVFRMTQGAAGPVRIDDLWRGTVLSAPIAAIAAGPEGRVCVLHRGDPVTGTGTDDGTRSWQAWVWTGFGFSPDDQVDCAHQSP